METVAEVIALASQSLQAGNFARAEQLFRQILRGVPDHSSALNGLAVVLVQQNKLDEAAANLQAVLRSQPDNAETHNNLGSVLMRLGWTGKALDAFRQAVRLKPDYAQAHYNLGLALKTLGQRDQAMPAFQEALRIQPDLAPASHDLGDLFSQNGELIAAERHYRQALHLRPQRAETHDHLGCVLEGQGRLDEAVACYRQAVSLNPNSADAHLDLGRALQIQGTLVEPIDHYRQALTLQPNLAIAHHNLGVALRDLGKLEEAADSLRRAVQQKPEYVDAHANLAIILMQQGQRAEAVAAWRRAAQLAPRNGEILVQCVHYLQMMCHWEGLEDLSRQVIASVEEDTPAGNASPATPFQFMSLPVSTTAQQQLQCARKWVERHLKKMSDVRCPVSDVEQPEVLIQDTGHRTPDTLTIGYLSADFHQHAIAYLIAELIEKHDREHLAIYGYSFGSDDKGPMRRRLVKAFDRFVDLKEVSFAEAARCIRSDAVNILVDLQGYTGKSRTQILALRPSPIQVNYLGYPGTMGAPFVDYILVDDFIVPPDQQPYFTEKLVHLPGCYQVNDSCRETAAHTPARADCGLPEEGFVFCCFNNAYKFTPQVFDVWMRLLNAVPGSVLWLLEANRMVPANLRTAAQARGVAPERLVFAPPLPMPQHLARHRLADLFLDTLPYNAHTTASDSLWMGCPVVTVAGQTFASRVAGSLLRAIGLPELITTSLPEYEELALRLARDPDLLAHFRARLQANRKTSGLFDGGRFARSLEQAYAAMWEIHASGQSPRAFAVT
jgi:protein O-GlcNAc transferase